MHLARSAGYVRRLFRNGIPSKALIYRARSDSDEKTKDDHRTIRELPRRNPPVHAAKSEKLRQHTVLSQSDPRSAPMEYLENGTVLFPVHTPRFRRNGKRYVRDLQRFDRTESIRSDRNQRTPDRVHEIR